MCRLCPVLNKPPVKGTPEAIKKIRLWANIRYYK